MFQVGSVLSVDFNALRYNGSADKQGALTFGHSPPVLGYVGRMSGEVRPAQIQSADALGQSSPSLGDVGRVPGEVRPAQIQSADALGQSPPTLGNVVQALG